MGLAGLTNVLCKDLVKLRALFTYTIILLIGMWINLTKKPINPIIAKPIAVAMAIFWNSAKSNRKNLSGSLMGGIQMCTAVTKGEISLYRTILTLETLQNLHRCSETNPLFQKTDEIFREKMQISTKNGRSQSFLNKQNQKYPQRQIMEHLSHYVSFTSVQALKLISNTASKMENLYLSLSQEDSTIRPRKNRVLGIFSNTLGQQPRS